MLTRYKGHGPSIFTLYKRSNSQTSLSKISYLINQPKALKPLTQLTDEKSEDPIDDVGVMAAITTIPQIHYKHHEDLVLPSLPAIKNLNNEIDLLIKKFKLCSTICDFADPDVDVSAKRAKTSNLQEIENLFNDEKNINTVASNSQAAQELFDMISVNLFRGIPSTDPKYLIYDSEPPIVESTWPHLQYIYSILLKFQKAKPKDSHINYDFLQKVYTLLEAPDISERSCVLDFLKEYSKAYPDQIPKILHHFEAIVRDYVDRSITPFPIMPILNFFLGLLKEPNSSQNYELYTRFLDNAIVPLISAQHILTYSGIMTEIFDLFIDADSNYAIKIIKKLVAAWPQSCPSKQQVFITFINNVTGKLTPDDFKTAIPIVFGLYSKVAKSSHAKIVQASLRIWSDVKIIPMIMDNTALIFPIVFQSIQNVMKNHWNPQARNQALEVLTSMHDYDPFVFDELSQQQTSNAMVEKTSSTNNGSASIASVSQPPKHRNWAMIARMAARRDNNMNLARVLADIQVKFGEQTQNADPKKKKMPKIVQPVQK
ncbi:hypothetical protein M9Y10_008160 [Tritrichomonas musculus]|uniref:Phosphoprotein phosphatase n=1 Tax=Tritrichomonas musculus TaxID=1915356 RepID=A0ABR2IXG8_9EUKA